MMLDLVYPFPTRSEQLKKNKNVQKPRANRIFVIHRFLQSTDQLLKSTTLCNNARIFRMWFFPSKFKLLLQDRHTSTPELMIGSKLVEYVNHFTYLQSIISFSGLMSNEILAWIPKSRTTFHNVRHLWYRRDVRQPAKESMFCPVTRSILLYNLWKKTCIN